MAVADTCGLCGGPMSAAVVEIRDGHRCEQCGQPMRLAFPVDGDRVAAPDASDIQVLLRGKGVRLAKRRGRAGLIHVCPQCGARQEADSTLRNATALAETVPASACGKCGHWTCAGCIEEWDSWIVFLVVFLIMFANLFVSSLRQ